MLDWLKNKKYPEFWKSYLQEQENKSTRYVTLSIQTTGLNPQKDVILSIACVGIQSSKVVVRDTFEVVLLQYVYNHDHGLSNEFIVESKMAKYTEAQGIERLIVFLKNAIIIGYRVDLDLEMINKALEKLDCGKLKNEALDLEIMYNKWKEYSDDKKHSIIEIANALKIPDYDHELAIEEAYTMALCFLKLKKYLGIH